MYCPDVNELWLVASPACDDAEEAGDLVVDDLDDAASGGVDLEEVKFGA